MARRLLSSILVAAAIGGAPHRAGADPVIRHQLLVNGDFALFGNTLAHDCSQIPASQKIVAGTGTAPATNQCGLYWNDTGVDVFWQTDPAGGPATASMAIAPDQARSTAVLSIPPGATVRYARLYWAAQVEASAYDPDALLTTPDGAVTSVTADQGLVVPVIATDRGTVPVDQFWYQSSADVTGLLQSLVDPRGPYTVGGVSTVDVRDYDSHTTFAAWWAVVFYEDPSDPALRQLTLFDGLDFVMPGTGAAVTLGGFRVPAGFDAKLGVVAYEGDSAVNNDYLFFQGYRSVDPEPEVLTTVEDVLNPANDFFNGTRGRLGAPATLAGDRPQMTGDAGTMMGLDLDVVDIAALGAIAPGHDAAEIRATSMGLGDVYALGAFITSINTLRPSFLATEKSATNLSRAEGIFAGDVIEYVVSTVNTGNDPSVETVLEDPLPAGVTFVPGSLRLVSGANAGPKTDQAGDDQGEYDAAARKLVVRLGAGADASSGGAMAVGERAEIRFRVQVAAGTSGTLYNQAQVAAGGLSGEPVRTFPSRPPGGGDGPTPLPVDACAVDADCGGATPACDTDATPNVCVACTSDLHCGGGTPICDASAHVCVGLSTITPAAQQMTTVAGSGAPFAMTLTSHVAGAETYDLDVSDPGCGWGVELRDAGGAPLGTRDAAGVWTLSPGGDTNGDGLPDVGETQGGGGTSAFALWLTPPEGTPQGATCTATVSARGASTGLTAAGSATLRTGPAAAWTPDWTGPSAKAVARGGTVAFPGVIQNNTGAPLTFDLAATVTAEPDAGALSPAVLYSDPDGDGDPADGAPIASTGAVAAHGGSVHVVLVVRASTASGSPLATGTTLHALATASAGSVVATQASDARVRYAATYSDAGRTAVRSHFAPCDTVYVGAALLPSGAPYAIEWYASAAPVRGVDVVRAVDPWPVSGGAATDALVAPAGALGTWSVLVVRKTSPETVLEAITFELERAGAFVSLSVPERIGMNQALSVSASVRNDNAVASFAGSGLAYSVTDGAVYMDGAGAFGDAPATAHFTSSLDVAPAATASDSWSAVSPQWPAPGVYRVDAQWRLQCGAAPAIAEATVSFEVAPAAPAIVSPEADALLATRTPTFSGTGLPGADVMISVGSESCGPVTVDEGGSWICTLGASLEDGAHLATATQVLRGAASDPSAAVAFTLDATPPGVAIEAPSDDALLGAAEAPGRVVAFSGSAEAGASVTVAAGGNVTAASRAGTAWSATLTLEADGTHTAVATATDAAGNVATAEITFTVDTVPPLMDIGFPADGAVLGAGDLSGPFLTVFGSSEPGAIVSVTIGAETATATATGAGGWSATFTPGDGTATVTATARDLAGNVSAPVSAAFTVDSDPPGEPDFTFPTDGAALSAAEAPLGALTLAGSTDPDTAVTVTVDGSEHAASVSGTTWTLSLTLGDGTHAVSAGAVDLAGNASDPRTILFSLDAHAPEAPEVTVASPTRADPIAVGGSAEPGSTVELFLDGASAGTTTAGPGGSFSFPLALVPEGWRELRATATDAAGNVSSTSEAVSVVVDRTAPDAPLVEGPAAGAVVPFGSVVFRGTAEAGATVSVTVNGVTESGVAADGTFSIPVTLPAGVFTATVTAADDAGNVSTPTARTFTVAQDGGGGGGGSATGGGDAGGGGCGCSEAGRASPSVLLLLAFGLALAPRRRARCGG